MKIFKTIALLTLILFFGGSMAYAGAEYSGYSTTVGKINGSGYTTYEVKAKSGANGNLLSYYVGGDYTVDARMQESDGTAGAWTRNIDDDNFYELDGHVNHMSGDLVRVHFSNDWTTLVSVQVEGYWRSNQNCDLQVHGALDRQLRGGYI